jgi:mRNA interferase HicA
MNYRELTKKLKSLGCKEIPRRSGGSHRKWFNPTTEKGTTIPDWGQKDLKAGRLQQCVGNSVLTKV